MSGMIQKSDGGDGVPEQQDSSVADGQQEQSVAWYLDEGIPGTGNRPDWLESKYNKVSDQAKAYKEVERKLGAQSSAAPEDYEWGEYANNFEIENPHMSDLKNKARELRLSQEAFQQLIDPIAKYQQSLMPNTDEEIKKLGEHAQAKINTVNTWATNHLSDRALETLGRISQTADVVEMIDEIRQLHHQTMSKVPTNMTNISKAVVISPESVQQEIVTNYAKYQEDPRYRQEMQMKLKQAFGED